MSLPVEPPVSPMLAAPGGDTVPDEPTGTVGFEPKWDGFRALIFRDGDGVVVQGRGGDDLAYAFPEVVVMARAHLPDRVVLDGELVIIAGTELDFEALGSRLRPRSEAGKPSIARLAESTPATFVAFDLLALGDVDHMNSPFTERRATLVSAIEPRADLYVTPLTDERATAVEWFATFEGAGLDGLIMKRYADPYTPGKRTLVKIKHRRTLDAVVAGWRPHKSNADEVASLLLGLYDDEGRLHHVGVASGFGAKRRAELAAELAPLALAEGASHAWLNAADGTRVPGAENRWSKGRGTNWHPLTPTLVAEVAYDAFEGDRLRHVAAWQRWRPDRDPLSCGYGQVARPTPFDVRAILDGEVGR